MAKPFEVRQYNLFIHYGTLPICQAHTSGSVLALARLQVLQNSGSLMFILRIKHPVSAFTVDEIREEILIERSNI